ncbi:MAG: hypothetical protein IH602_00180 [Bryobacteraceae bacterium]|nr:hypothetical protein [Bryobacteraceae bacterium]
MTFEEASARFAQLEAIYRGGQMAHPQFVAAAGELRVQDAAGAWWQIDPQTRAWLKWDGAAWVNPAQAQVQFRAPQAYPQQPQQYAQTRPQGPGYGQPGAPVAVQPQQAAAAGSGAWDGIVSVMPGLAVDAIQRWPMYKQNPQMAVGVVAPALISGLLVPMVPKIGRAIPMMVVLGCLGWLCWPVISGWAEISKESKGVQNQMGRGLVGMSLVYLIPRIWRMKS